MARLDNSQIAKAIGPLVSAIWQTADFSIDNLGGHASYRLYHRLIAAPERPPNTPPSLIVMELCGDPLGSEEATDGRRPQRLPFLDVQAYLAAGEIAVPACYGYLPEQGLLLLEDLGTMTFEAALGKAGDRRSLYRQAIDFLVALQRYTAQPEENISFRRRFDPSLLKWELDHFVEWLLVADRGVELSAAQRALIEQAAQRIIDELVALPQIWVHRDYQSRNLMVQQSDAGLRLRLIDFQDALVGPLPYDLVALLRDSYVDVGDDLDPLIDYYHAQAQAALDLSAYRRAFFLQTLQRKLKDAGRFIFIDRVKGNPSFLCHLPLTLGYVKDALARLDDFAELRELLADLLPELR